MSPTVTTNVPYRRTRMGAVLKDVQALTHVRSHRLVALPEYSYEALKIGAGPPFAFYRMADSSIGVASLDRIEAP